MPESDAIRAVVARLARPHSSGGLVIGRATLLAEGTAFAAIEAWILSHGGKPEMPAPRAGGVGLHGAGRLSGGGAASGGATTGYVLPAEALREPAAPLREPAAPLS